MGNDGHGCKVQLMHKLGEIVNKGRHFVVAVGLPLAVPMASQVGCYDVPILAQFLRCPVPAAAMITPAMDQEQRRRVGVAPIHMMQA